MDKAKTKNTDKSQGKTTVAPEVLLTIARLTTLDVTGVSRMGNVPGGANRLFSRRFGDGVRINIEDDTVSADIYVILKDNINIRDTSRNIQRNIARAISEMVGMQVGRVNIHIEDIDYPIEEEQDQNQEA
ncbi:Asp23/Gls24 family envelope stress response protein [Chloroflexota bacterium]